MIAALLRGGDEMDFLTFEFELSEPIGPVEPIEENPDLLLNVVADFRLFVGHNVIYRDVNFPVAELALALAAWAERVSNTGESFSFDSRSSALRSLIQILRGAQGWSLTSIQEELPSPCVFPLEQILDAVQSFLGQVESRVDEAYGFSVLALRR